MLPTRPGEHFGGVLRTACVFYGLEHCQLFLTRGTGEPLPIEASVGSVGAEGVFLPVTVHPYEPSAGSFEVAVIEIAKTLGANFKLQRQDRILELPSQSPSSSSKRPRRPDPMVVGDKVVLPGDFSGARQYFHIYYTKQHKLVTFHASLATVLERLVHENQSTTMAGDEPLSEVQTPELLKGVEMLHQQVKQWFLSSVGSEFNRPRRQCSMSLQQLTLGDISKACAPRFRSQALAPESVERSPPLGGSASSCKWDVNGVPQLGGAACSPVSEEAAPENTGAEPCPDYGGFFCPLKGRGELFDASSEGVGEDDNSELEGASGPSSSSSSCPDRDSWRLSHLTHAPQTASSTMVAVAACSAPLLLTKPMAQWVVREVTDTFSNGNGTIMLASNWPKALGQGVASASGALTGAALASPMGPVAAVIGGISGALCSNSAQRWLASRPQVHNLLNDHGYTLSTSASNGKMYLAHKETVGSWPGMNGLLSTALVSASIQGVSNLWAYSNGEISARDVALAFLKDVRDGATVWLTVKGFVTAMTVGELRASGLLSSACSLALHYPVPVTFGMLGCCFVTVRCINYTLNRTSLDQFQSNMVLMTASNAVGIAVSVGANTLGVPPIAGVAMTCAISYGAGVWAHEVWRSSQQRYAEDRLRCMARELLGLPHDYTAEMLRRRWRTLARLAHPDRNRQPDAHKTFTLFQLCRDVLEEALLHPGRDAGRLRGLLRYLRRACWLERSNLPPMNLLPKHEWARSSVQAHSDDLQAGLRESATDEVVDL